MKTNKLLAAAALAIAASGAQANLVQNGSFEADSQAAGSFGIYPTLSGGWSGPALPLGIELRNNRAGIAQDGVNFVELDTNNNSSMSQSINTVAGVYQLSFWYSAREGVAAGSNGLDFSFGSLSGNVLNGVAGAASGHIWQQYTGLVTLLGGPTTLTFSAVETSDSFGGSLDNISVTAVPEPETYAMLLAGLGLMGTIARRRKNSPV